MPVRILIALLLGAAAWAQPPGGPGQIIPVLAFPPQLKDYLGLTNEQAGRIVTLNVGYAGYAAGKAPRTAQLQREIAVEQARDPLDPMALGVRYAELETIRRDLDGMQAEARRNALALLNGPQRARLKTLEDASSLQSIAVQARLVNLIGEVAPATSLAGLFPALPPELKAYLNLTDEQAETIARRNRLYQQDSAESALRAAQFQRQIQEETARPAIDAMALGVLYAELEHMERDLRRQQAEIRKDALVALNDAQRAKLNALEEADRLQPRVWDAVCQNLLPSPLPAQPRGTFTFSQVVDDPVIVSGRPLCPPVFAPTPLMPPLLP